MTSILVVLIWNPIKIILVIHFYLRTYLNGITFIIILNVQSIKLMNSRDVLGFSIV